MNKRTRSKEQKEQTRGVEAGGRRREGSAFDSDTQRVTSEILQSAGKLFTLNALPVPY